MSKKIAFECLVCGRAFTRYQAQVDRGATKTCSKKCLGTYFKGKGNPFWGRTHSAETRKRVSGSRKGKARGNQNAKGYKHTESAKQRIGAASRTLWAEHRDEMIESLPRGEKHHFHKPPELRRYRKNFSPRQRRELISDTCAYCGRTDLLVLDHIIPVFDGGTNADENAQTLCQPCNLWKTKHVDLPRYYLSRKGARH